MVTCRHQTAGISEIEANPYGKGMSEKLTPLLQAGEGYHTEFKQGLDKSFVEEACAFANSGGGRILLGVADNGVIKGIDTGNAMRSRVQDILGQIEPRLSCDIQVVDNVLMVRIPEGMEKPYGCSRGFFMRMGANSQKLTRNQIIEFFQKEGRIRFDELRNPKAVYPDDFDQVAKEKVTILDKKDFTGNIVDNIDNALLFVQRHTKVRLKIEHLQHEEIPDYPEVALREAIINAVCHRDYFDKRANVLVEVFADRVVITNPGGLPSGLSPEEFGTKSVARNPRIASLLHRIDYIEKVGTGIMRIRQAVAEHGGTELELKYNDFFTATFRARVQVTGQVGTKTESGAESKQVTGQVTGQVEAWIGKVLTACLEPRKSSEIQQIVGIKHRETFQRNYLDQLLDGGLIERTIPDKPQSRMQKYRLTDKGRAILEQDDGHE
jgi:ATP-dependent DNA helicase RecG